MSYWGQASVSSTQLDDLLSKEDVSLLEVMDESEVLQECKSQNKKLVDYLIRPDVLRELIFLSTREPENDSPDALKYKYANIATELLTSELPQMIQTIANEQPLLSELYAFLEVDPPLNPLLASFFSRILGMLITKTSEQNWFAYQVSCLQVLEFIKNRGNFIALLLRHMGTSAIMDLILKMYVKLEGQGLRENFLRVLDEGEFLEQLVAQINPESNPDVRSNVCQLLCEMVLASRETPDGPESDPISKKIESEEYVKRILEQMALQPRCEGSIVGGISVLITLLVYDRRDEYTDASRDLTFNVDPETVISNTVAAIIPHLPFLTDVLHNPPPKNAMRTTIGVLDPPLGAARVEVARLIATLVATGRPALLSQVENQNVLSVLLDLFFQYPWNNFFHAQVEATIVAAIRSSLVSHILSECRLLQRILDAWNHNDVVQKDNHQPRRGYMGHLIRIANIMAEETAKRVPGPITNYVDEDIAEKWRAFIEGSLAKVNGDQKSSEWDKSHEETGHFYNELHYNKSGTPNFVENFNSELIEHIDESSDIEVQTMKPEFPGLDSEAEFEEHLALFSQKLPSLEENADLWNSIIRTNETRSWNNDNSFDEDGSGHNNDEVDDDWLSSAVTDARPVEQSNPWSADIVTVSTPPDQSGWATFETSPFLANFSFDLSSTIATSAPGDADCESFDLTPTEPPPQFPPQDEASSIEKDAKREEAAWIDEIASRKPIEPGMETAKIHEIASAKPIEPGMETAKIDEIASAKPIEPVMDTAEIAAAKPFEPIAQTAETEPVTETENIDEFAAAKSIEPMMETAEIVENERHAAEIVAVCDFACADKTLSSCVAAERLEAFTQETVIPQTEPTGTMPSTEVAVQLAELLEQVTLSSSSSTNDDVDAVVKAGSEDSNGPLQDAAGDVTELTTPPDANDITTPHINSRLEPTIIDESVSDNNELGAPNELSDHVPTSKLAVNEEATRTPNDRVTAI